MKLNLNEIKSCTSSITYIRALSYFKENRVEECNVVSDSDTKVVLQSCVLGSFGKKYMQVVYIERRNKLSIVGTCNCPVGHNCKHIIASCIKYNVDGMQKVTTPETKTNLLDNWLNSLSVDKSKKSGSNSSDYFITYRLFSQDRNSDELKFYKSKILKSGGIGKGSRLDSYRFTDDYYFKDMKNRADIEIAKLASNLGFDRWNNSAVKLKGIFGASLLQEMVATNRCYYDTNTDSLKFTDGIFKPLIEFKLVKDQYRVISNINYEYKLVETKPPYILNSDANTIQEFGMDIITFKKLLNAPEISKQEIGRVYNKIGKSVANIEMSTPKGIKAKKIDTKPTPQIYFRSRSFKVNFNYSGFESKYEPREKVSSFYKNDEKIEITRYLKYEEDAKSKIESFNFDVELIDGDIVVELKDANRQQQLKAFKEFISLHVESLEADGWAIKNIDNFDMKFEESSEVVVESESENDWFSLSFNLEFNGVSQPIAPLVTAIMAEFDNFESMPEFVNIEVNDDHFVEVQTSQILPIINTIIELMDKKDRDDTLKISAYDAHMINSLDDNIIWKGSREILELSAKLKNFDGIKRVEPPKVLNATLRDYQQSGLNWLNFLYEFKFAGILADDMGLGKTIQTLAHLSRLKEESKLNKPSLIVMPTSLIANWKNEAKKFTPNLNVLSLHGSDRADRFDEVENSDILLTTYALIIRDKEKFDKLQFSYIILDEAQKIKNPKTKMAIAIKEFKSEYRLALSGTPIENHLGELWSIFSFLMPGFLDTLSFFKKYYQTPIEKDRSFSRQEILNKRIKPFMIRRTKELVASELPDKSEIIKYTQFESKQSALYESIRVAMEEKVRQTVESKGLGSSHITILDALLKLRQVCCDPSLLKIKEAQKIKDSAKLELFLDLVDELLLEGRKILVFSQFTSMLSIIEKKLKLKKINYSKLTGSTTKREEAINQFTKGRADIFLISLKAGGVGLNLVEADTVIHYDPWWNPAVENQATDRAYRIGQTKAVFVYKLIVENTIEQKILELQKKKEIIQDGIYDEDKQQDDTKFSGNDLLELLK
ncbi:MAG: DEAD/DEAH box helicase [Campylobacterota bacterium]|nr:DEAD/DEAH box helicase [Campylobacterota bacterium]